MTALDRHAVRHWMPWLHPARHRLIAPSALFLPQLQHSFAATLVSSWTYPASAAVSAALVAVAARALWRRGAELAALSWCLVWVVANLLELTGKLVISRPHLYAIHGGARVYVPGFDHSFPSGHTVRACIVAGALAGAWPGLRNAALVWALTIPVALVVLGDHTPTDVLGGLLLGAALLAARSRRRTSPRGAEPLS